MAIPSPSVATITTSENPIRSGWKDVEEVRDPDGVVAVISRRVNGPPVHTIAMFKWYLADGEEKRSVFWSVTKQGPAALRVIQIAIVRAKELETKAYTDGTADLDNARHTSRKAVR